jgi:ribosomal protein S18 acetylase RimI-like enzyme
MFLLTTGNGTESHHLRLAGAGSVVSMARANSTEQDAAAKDAACDRSRHGPLAPGDHGGRAASGASGAQPLKQASGIIGAVTAEFPERCSFRHPDAQDHPRVVAVLEAWWNASPAEGAPPGIAGLAHRLFFEHFSDTSYLAEGPDGRLMAFLIGFLSQSQPGIAYIHLAGVDPALRRAGLGAAMYRRFFDEAIRRGAHTVRCVTGPRNRASLAFHRAMGFAVDPSESMDARRHRRCIPA